jgi:hypothetical protein
MSRGARSVRIERHHNRQIWPSQIAWHRLWNAPFADFRIICSRKADDPLPAAA